MPTIPILLKLRKSVHKNIAKAQDLIIEELYKVFDKAVLHGGTAIWRCYNGNRFSEDVDVCIQKDTKKINIFFKNLEKRGFVIKKKKIGERSLFSVLQLNRIIVRFEATFRKIKGELKEYETVDGNLITVYTLLPEEIIKEKVDTYLKRAKIRDIYDIFFLLRYVKDENKTKTKLKELINKFKKPVDEKELRILIIEGIVPDIKKMMEYIKREIRGN